MNHYKGSYVPPGWDKWFAISGEPDPGKPCEINDDHALKTFTHTERDLTDLLADEAVSFMRETREPFFLYLAPRPPHRVTLPSPQHEGAYANVAYPDFPSYDEEDVSDKPSWVWDRERLGPEEHALVDSLYQDRLRTLLDLDDLVRRVVANLEASGKLENTYIIFTSDTATTWASIAWYRWTKAGTPSSQPTKKTSGYRCSSGVQAFPVESSGPLSR